MVIEITSHFVRLAKLANFAHPIEKIKVAAFNMLSSFALQVKNKSKQGHPWTRGSGRPGRAVRRGSPAMDSPRIAWMDAPAPVFKQAGSTSRPMGKRSPSRRNDGGPGVTRPCMEMNGCPGIS